MKRVLIIAVVAAVVSAFGGTASIVASFTSPCSSYAWGIDYHGGYVYHGDGHNYIYRTTTTGSLLDSLDVGNASAGIDRTDFEFWCCNLGGFIFRLSTTGSVIRSFEGPAYEAYGITHGEGFLWCSDALYLYKLTVNGSLIGSFRLPATSHRGLCWAAPYLWTASNARRMIYQTTQSGIVVDSFGTVPGYTPHGVTWDGSYLWYTASSGVLLYVYKARLCFTAVTPASLGRVKALFR
jgi:hypothetical protein